MTIPSEQLPREAVPGGEWRDLSGTTPSADRWEGFETQARAILDVAYDRMRQDIEMGMQKAKIGAMVGTGRAIQDVQDLRLAERLRPDPPTVYNPYDMSFTRSLAASFLPQRDVRNVTPGDYQQLARRDLAERMAMGVASIPTEIAVPWAAFAAGGALVGGGVPGIVAGLGAAIGADMLLNTDVLREHLVRGRFLERTSGRYLRPGQSNARDGSGFTRQEIGEAVRFIEDMGRGDTFFTPEEIDGLTEKFTFAGQFDAVRSVNDFRQAFTQAKENLQLVMQEMGTSIEEGMGVLQQATALGVQQGDVAPLIRRARISANQMGISQQAALSLSFQQGATLFQGTGVDMALGVDMAASNMETLGRLESFGGIRPEALRQMGGLVGASNELAQIQSTMLQHPTTRRALMAAYEGGGMLNPETLARAMTGELSSGELYRMAGTRMRGAERLEFEGRLPELLSNMEPEQLQQLWRRPLQDAALRLKQARPDIEINAHIMKGLAQQYFGLDPNQAELVVAPLFDDSLEAMQRQHSVELGAMRQRFALDRQAQFLRALDPDTYLKGLSQAWGRGVEAPLTRGYDYTAAGFERYIEGLAGTERYEALAPDREPVRQFLSAHRARGRAALATDHLEGLLEPGALRELAEGETIDPGEVLLAVGPQAHDPNQRILVEELGRARAIQQSLTTPTTATPTLMVREIDEEADRLRERLAGLPQGTDTTVPTVQHLMDLSRREGLDHTTPEGRATLQAVLEGAGLDPAALAERPLAMGRRVTQQRVLVEGLARAGVMQQSLGVPTTAAPTLTAEVIGQEADRLRERLAGLPEGTDTTVLTVQHLMDLSRREGLDHTTPEGRATLQAVLEGAGLDPAALAKRSLEGGLSPDMARAVLIRTEQLRTGKARPEQTEYLDSAPAERVGQAEPVDLRARHWSLGYDTRQELVQQAIRTGRIDLGEQGLRPMTERELAQHPDRDQLVIVGDAGVNRGVQGRQVWTAPRAPVEDYVRAHDTLTLGLERSSREGPVDYEKEIEAGTLDTPAAQQQERRRSQLMQAVRTSRRRELQTLLEEPLVDEDVQRAISVFLPEIFEFSGLSEGDAKAPQVAALYEAVVRAAPDMFPGFRDLKTPQQRLQYIADLPPEKLRMVQDVIQQTAHEEGRQGRLKTIQANQPVFGALDDAQERLGTAEERFDAGVRRALSASGFTDVARDLGLHDTDLSWVPLLGPAFLSPDAQSNELYDLARLEVSLQQERRALDQGGLSEEEAQKKRQDIRDQEQQRTRLLRRLPEEARHRVAEAARSPVVQAQLGAITRQELTARAQEIEGALASPDLDASARQGLEQQLRATRTALRETRDLPRGDTAAAARQDVRSEQQTIAQGADAVRGVLAGALSDLTLDDEEIASLAEKIGGEGDPEDRVRAFLKEELKGFEGDPLKVLQRGVRAPMGPGGRSIADQYADKEALAGQLGVETPGGTSVATSDHAFIAKAIVAMEQQAMAMKAMQQTQQTIQAGMNKILGRED